MLTQVSKFDSSYLRSWSLLLFASCDSSRRDKRQTVLFHFISNYRNINHKSLYSLGAGFTARSVCSCIMLPITIVKTRMEYNKVLNDTIYHTCKNVLTMNKKGLFSGLIPTILRDAPNSGLYICIYHSIKPHIMQLREDNEFIPITFLNLLTGIIAGITSTFLTHPFDMIKTQMQINGIYEGNG